MSDIGVELERVDNAFRQPTLRLLHQKHAAIIIALFRTCFGQEARPIPTGRMHEQVENYFAMLSQIGVADQPGGTGREVCRRWVADQWLMRVTQEDGTDVYTLTSHAQDALSLVKSLTRERASLSEHRISTILTAVRRFNTDVNPDRTARVQILDAEISRLSEERDRLLAGAPIPEVSADYMREGFGELLALVQGLPGDFLRVQESFRTLRRQILKDFQDDTRSAGEVVGAYLERAETLESATPEGRAFQGAFTLLTDRALLAQLREDLADLLGHPAASQVLGPVDRSELRGTVALIRQGMRDTLDSRNRVSVVVREHVARRDVAGDRQLDAVLRALEGQLTQWLTHAGPNSKAGVHLLPERADVGHLRQAFYDEADELVPDALPDAHESPDEATSLSALRASGGPSLVKLRERIDAALEGPNPSSSLGEIFASLEPDLRRPVEIFGLLHLAANREDLELAAAEEVYESVRPDGSTRRLQVPRVVPVARANESPDQAGDSGPGGTHDRLTHMSDPTGTLPVSKPDDSVEPAADAEREP